MGEMRCPMGVPCVVDTRRDDEHKQQDMVVSIVVEWLLHCTSHASSKPRLRVMTRALRNVLEFADFDDRGQLVLATTDTLLRILICDNNGTNTSHFK